MVKCLLLSYLQVALYVAELQVCTATRSPCEDQALPLSWAPPSSTRALKKGLIFMPLRIVYLKSFSNFYKLVQIFDSQEVIIKKTGHIALIFRFYCPVFGLSSQDLTQILLRHSAS